MDPLKVIAGLLVLLAVVNVYFLVDALRIHRAVDPRSPLLWALAGVALAVWLVGAYIAFIAARLLLNLPPLPFNGIGVGAAILVLELLPGFIRFQMRHFLGGDADES